MARSSAVMSNDFTPLDFAAEYNHVAAAELLCSYGAGPRESAAEQADRAGHTHLATWLGATADWITPLHHLHAVSPRRAYAFIT